MGFFKAYDMRGTFGKDFDLTTVYKVGKALPAVVGGTRWLVGRDARETSPAVRDALVAGLRAAGAEVTDIGRVTTPMIYFFTAEDDFDGSVMITASHNPPTDNGLKVSRRGALPVGGDSGLKEVEARVAADDSVYTPASAPAADVDEEKYRARYLAWMRAHGAFDYAASGLEVAVDCSDGMASLLAHELFPGAVFSNDVPDGSFPHHAPNPLLASAREQIAACVKEKGLDCGVIFDGDADRCMFVDETGAFIQPDYLIPVLAESFDERGTVIHDVRTSRGATERLRADGFTPVMGKVGHAFAKVLLRETKAVCGGELAGHYYFRDFHFCDSGVFAALRILSRFALAKKEGKSVSALMSPIVGAWSNSGELNFRVKDKDGAIARCLAVAKGFGEETGRSEIDGVRLEYATGWVSIRKSNTEPFLRLLVECDLDVRRQVWTAVLASAITLNVEH